MQNIEIYNFNEYEVWKNQFEELRNNIMLSKDKLAYNYSFLNLNLSEQDDATIIVHNDKIIAFSFLYSRKKWRYFNSARVLNRFWIDPLYRRNLWNVKHSITEELGYSICDIMFEKQITSARKNNYNFVFVSRNYPALAWQRNFIKKNSDWYCNYDVLWELITGNCKEGYQHCVWLPLGVEKNFPFSSISIDSFKQKYLGKLYEKF